MSTFQNLIQKRRSVYHLGNHALLPQEEILHLIEGCVLNAPSSFNAQSARVVVLFGQPYRQFWDMVKRTLRAVVPADKFAPTEEKINSFAAGFGTILFFEDDSITQTLQQKFPLYRDKFPVWAQHGNAILQYMIWTALAEKNIGASLQHYNPLIDEATRKLVDVPNSWQLIAQMPFGSIEQTPGSKTHEPLENRIKILK